MKNLLPVTLLLPLLARALPAANLPEALADGVIPNAWIVELKDTAGAQGLDSHLSWLDSVTKEVTAFSGRTRKYDFDGFVGYAGEFDKGTLEKIKARPEVAAVEQDGVVGPAACGRQSTPGPGEWGLGRISHPTRGPWNEYLYNTSQPYCPNSKAGVVAYVIDSGIFVEHTEFQGRASFLYKAEPGWNNKDNCGHGTHVAGIIGGKTYGIAKNATFYAVKALEGGPRGRCGGTWSGVISAIGVAFSHAKSQGTTKKAIINMSLGGSTNFAVNRAVQSAVTGGITVVVAAGNNGGNACNNSPASSSYAISVGASDIADSVAFFSNVGCCVSIFAPGVEIKSSFIGSPSATAIYSGTSMSSPHVAGIVLYNKCLFGYDTPSKDRAGILGAGVKGALLGNLCVSKPCCAENLLAQNRGCEAL